MKQKVKIIRRRLVTDKRRLKSYANRRRRPLVFGVGEHVFLEISRR